MSKPMANRSHPWEQHLQALHREFSVLEQELVLLKSIDQAILKTGSEGSDTLEKTFVETVARFGVIHRMSGPVLCYVYLDPGFALLPGQRSPSCPVRLEMSDALDQLLVVDQGTEPRARVVAAEQGDGLFGEFPGAKRILLCPMYYKPKEVKRLLCVFLLTGEMLHEGSDLQSTDFVNSLQTITNQLSIAYLHSERLWQQRRLEELWAAFLRSQLSPFECFQALAARIAGFMPEFGPLSLDVPLDVQILTPVRDTRSGSIRHLLIQGTTGSEAAGVESVALDRSICGLLVQDKMDYFYDDPTDPKYGGRFRKYLGEGHEIRTEFAVPLLKQDVLVGVLNLESEAIDAFNVHQRDAVRALAGVVAPLVDALDHSSADVQFSTDSTTGAYLDALASVFRHAINTPLASLRLNIDLAMKLIVADGKKPQSHSPITSSTGRTKGTSTSTPGDTLDEVLEALKRLPAIDQQISEWTRDFAADIGSYGATGPIVLADLVHSVVKLVRNGLLAKTDYRISINDDTEEQRNAIVLCSNLLKQHLYSIVHNSVLSIEQRMAYDPSPGAVSIRLEEISRPAEQEVILNSSWALHIKDNGPGVDSKQLSSLRRFTPGVRFRPGEGQGSGLVALQRYISFLGGRVELESEAGKYFEVVIFLKRHTPDLSQTPPTRN